MRKELDAALIRRVADAYLRLEKFRLVDQKLMFSEHMGYSAPMLDVQLAGYINVHAINGVAGARRQELIDFYHPMPVRTIRDALGRLMKSGAIIRADDKLYRSTKKLQRFYDDNFDEDFKLCCEFARAQVDFQKALIGV